MKKTKNLFTLHCLAAAALAWTASAHPAVPPGAAAEILNLQGQGDQRTGAAPDWKPARVAQPLAAGDYVRTRDASRMALLFADQTQLRLHQNTVLQVKGVATATQPVTTLLLEAGRAWAQTRRAPGSTLNLQTPAATAGIRGTDWDIEVGADGKTLLTVLSGEVTLTNAQGEVLVGSNEAAIAEVGKAPVKIQLTQPRDRIQWVNALTAEPQRFGGENPATAEVLVRADRQIADGETTQAMATLQAGLVRWPGSATLRAQLARAQLLGDRVDDSAATLAQAAGNDAPELWLARGALARRQGNAPATLNAYSRATQLAPQDDRGWFGLGSAHTEREDSAPARASLLRALELNPAGPGYRGELGTLETYRNKLAEADTAFAAALADNPGDYVALTGLGLLRLKQGAPEAALDAFLRAGVMEPRYARAKTYTAVAYWQLGRHQDAIVTLQQAAALDDKDPVPHLFLAQIYTDLFRAGDAVAASRAGVQRMPYLKSLNQLANDQQGRANFGASLAFFGMEDWALELAQQAYLPYWGGSHLFLADRYPGEFNKNSELFQGFLADPLAFGASPRFSSLLQRPGLHGALSMTLDQEFYRLASPAVTLNGLQNLPFPVAFFVKGQKAIVSRLPLDVGVSGLPAVFDPTGRADGRLNVATLGLGARPIDRLGVFAYYNDSDIRVSGRNRVNLFGGDTVSSLIDSSVRQAAVGASYQWSPTAQTWVKLGHSLEFNQIEALPLLLVEEGLSSLLGLYAQPRKRFTDLQLRHTMDLSPATRVSVGLEHVKERQHNEVAAAGTAVGIAQGVPTAEVLVFAGINDVDRRFTALTLAGQHQFTDAWRADGTLAINRLRHNTQGESLVQLLVSQRERLSPAQRHDTEKVLAPRLGAVYQPHAGLTVRAAYQDWLRPLSVSTLNSVETAGIPIEDRLVDAGGRMKRSVVQAGMTLGENTFVSGRLDHLRVNNPTSPGADLRTPSLPFLEELRNAQLVNLSATDVLEATPSFERGTLRAAALGVNQMFSRRFSGYAKFLHQDSQSSYDGTAGDVSGVRIPYLPRSTAVLGATWAGEQRLYLSGRVVWRSERFEDKENLTARPASWNLDLMGFWETADKHWVVGAAALNLLGKKSERQTRRLVIDARYRF